MNSRFDSRHDSQFDSWDEATFELALESMTVGVDESRRRSLDDAAGAEALESFESLLSAIHLSSLERVEEPPAHLLKSLEERGRERVSSADGIPMSAPRGGPQGISPMVTWAGWIAAAAALLMLLMGDAANKSLDPAASRDRLLVASVDAIQLDWVRTEDSAAASARGDVVWSKDSQEGYMRFVGLEPNDPSQSQYQLWIFDKSRADWEAKPVDGGVFDVSSRGDVIVPIDPKLAVRDSALFAITIEVPGGVVVSERERIVLTASP